MVFTTLASVLLLASLVLVVAEPPPAAGRRLTIGMQDEHDKTDVQPAAPQRTRGRTIMQCLGTETLTRACHFENIYYDLNTSRFVHYGMAAAVPDAFGDNINSEDPWLRLARCVQIAGAAGIAGEMSFLHGAVDYDVVTEECMACTANLN